MKYVLVLLLFLISASAALADITSNLTLYWAMDEGSGTELAPGGGTSNSGFFGGGPTWEAAAQCIINACLSFDGENDWIWFGGNTLNDIMSESTGTISLWAYAATTGPDGGSDIFELPGIMTDTSYQIGIFQGNPDGAGDLLWFMHSGTPISVAYTALEWMHLAWVHGGGNLSVYKNAVLIGTVSSTDITLDGEFMLSRNHLGPVYWPGRLDEVKVWNRALSGADILEEYHRGAPATPVIRRKPLMWSARGILQHTAR